MIAVAAIAVSSLAVASGGALAGAGACGTTSASNGCTAVGTGGFGEQFRWQVSDGDMRDNFYGSGLLTSDNVGSIKKGTSNFVWFCAWQNENGGGANRGHAANTTTWVATSVSDVTSVFLRTSASC